MTWPPFVSGPQYAQVLLEKALQAELVLMGDLAITQSVFCPFSCFLLPILAKNDLFWESLSNSMSSNAMPACSCKVCMFRYWLLYFTSVESRAMGLSPHASCPPHLFLANKEEVDLVVRAVTRQASLAQDRRLILQLPDGRAEAAAGGGESSHQHS